MLHNEIFRILDANINRASEALRVLEDWTRYGKNNLAISEKLKRIRHGINNSFLQFSNLITSRDSVNDVGRYIENPSKRNSLKDVLRANCKRLEESLRVLSEYGQLLSLDTKVLEESRYEIYTIEKELIKNERIFRLQSACLYLVAGRDAPVGRLSNIEFLKIIEKAIEGGIDIIQLREKNIEPEEIIKIGKEIKKLVTNTNILFIVNDRIDLALACDADGVHLGQDDFPVKEARKITPDGFIIGLSTHNTEQGLNGSTSSADYLGVGPVFPTPTKPDYKPAGLEYVKWSSDNLKEIPWFAIGGIDETNIDKVISVGAKKAAVVRAIINAKDPKKMAKQLKEMLETCHGMSQQKHEKVR